MSEDETRNAEHEEATDEVEAHSRKAAANVEAGDEAAADDVEAHSRPTDPDDSRRSTRSV